MTKIVYEGQVDILKGGRGVWLPDLSAVFGDELDDDHIGPTELTRAVALAAFGSDAFDPERQIRGGSAKLRITIERLDDHYQIPVPPSAEAQGMEREWLLAMLQKYQNEAVQLAAKNYRLTESLRDRNETA